MDASYVKYFSWPNPQYDNKSVFINREKKYCYIWWQKEGYKQLLAESMLSQNKQ